MFYMSEMGGHSFTFTGGVGGQSVITSSDPGGCVGIFIGEKTLAQVWINISCASKFV